MNLANITIVGRLGRDAESRYTPNGTAVLSFSVAVRNKRDREKTDWYTVSIYGKRADALAGLGLTKGTGVCVVGAFCPREYQAKDGTTRISFDVDAAEIELLGGKREDTSQVPF